MFGHAPPILFEPTGGVLAESRPCKIWALPFNSHPPSLLSGCRTWTIGRACRGESNERRPGGPRVRPGASPSRTAARPCAGSGMFTRVPAHSPENQAWRRSCKRKTPKTGSCCCPARDAIAGPSRNDAGTRGAVPRGGTGVRDGSCRTAGPRHAWTDRTPRTGGTWP